jgi:hypothetical protein
MELKPMLSRRAVLAGGSSIALAALARPWSALADAGRIQRLTAAPARVPLIEGRRETSVWSYNERSGAGSPDKGAPGCAGARRGGEPA